MPNDLPALEDGNGEISKKEFLDSNTGCAPPALREMTMVMVVICDDGDETVHEQKKSIGPTCRASRPLCT